MSTARARLHEGRLLENTDIQTRCNQFLGVCYRRFGAGGEPGDRGEGGREAPPGCAIGREESQGRGAGCPEGSPSRPPKGSGSSKASQRRSRGNEGSPKRRAQGARGGTRGRQGGRCCRDERREERDGEGFQ